MRVAVYYYYEKIGLEKFSYGKYPNKLNNKILKMKLNILKGGIKV